MTQGCCTSNVEQGVAGIGTLRVSCPDVIRFQSNTNVFVTITMYRGALACARVSDAPPRYL